jgi:ABC-type Fe3+/spermidine/putrescine transport system ATPase subunit
MAFLELDGVTKRYRDVTALDRVTLSVDEGEYVAVLGPTGAGKTTLLKTIAGLERQQEGNVLLDGSVVDWLEPDERGVAYLPQTYSLFGHMDVWDNAVFGPTVQGWPPEERDALGREMLSLVRLIERRDAWPRELSGGMQQRCALARALATSARLLLLDEPLRALDARLRIELRRELRSLSKHLGVTTIHVTHDQEEAMTVADRIVVLKGGRVLAVGPPEEVYLQPRDPFVANFLGEANLFEVTVETRDEGVGLRDSEGVAILAGRPREEAVPGTRLLAAVKTEKCALRADPPPAPNGFPCTVVRRLFGGRWTSFEVRRTDGRPWKARMPSSAARGFREGGEAYVAFAPEDVMLFPWPRGGLESVLEVE